MAMLFGHLQGVDLDYPFNTTEGQNILYDETTKVIQRWNQDLEAAISMFVGETTDGFKERIKLPGTGFSQEEDQDNFAPSASVKASGYFEVAYPLRQYGDSLSFTDVTRGYMSLTEYDNHLKTVLNKNNNTVFSAILKPIFNNVAQTFVDRYHGSLTIQCLANQDGTKYPPVFGSTSEAEENMYIGTAYAESSISSTNNPFKTIRDKLEPHYGFMQGGSPIVALVNSSTTPYAKALPGFDEYTNRYLVPGANVTTLGKLPTIPTGGRIIGVDSGVVIVEWPRIPAGYAIGLHEMAIKPLKRRVDLRRSGLPSGIQLVNRDVEYPFNTLRWRHRFGFGAYNRIGAVVMFFPSDADSTYDIPAAYA